MNKERVLISTMLPPSGGVREMLRFVTDCLIEAGYPTVLAYYQPCSVSPELSVPLVRLLRRRPGQMQGAALNGFEAHGFGAWLPEFEFTHYLPTSQWQELMGSCRYYLAVSGNCLPATPFAFLDRAFLAWVAADWADDRKAGVADVPWPRKILDCLVNRHVISKYEKTILNRGIVLALSGYTRKRLDARGAVRPVRGVLPMPVDLDFFRPSPNKVVPRLIGFSGRLDEPGKNIELLLGAVEECRRRGEGVEAELIGGPASPALLEAVSSPALIGAVRVVNYPERERLAERLQALDVFVIPSHQERLCIAALEAMACGCPVVSTRCGGPEEFVIDGNTGYLVDADPGAMADAIQRIVENRNLRAALSGNARSMVEKNYNSPTAKRIFWNAFYEAFPQ